MMKPKYPIYIISKGRYENGLRLTQEMLEKYGVPYRMVVEDSEFDAYAENVPEEKIIALPKDFRENPTYAVRCDVTNTLGGSIPVRNFVYEHSKSKGYKRHWILDDNMRHIYRLHNNLKTRMKTGSSFRILEDFTDRYTNVKLSGMNYDFFCPPPLCPRACRVPDRSCVRPSEPSVPGFVLSRHYSGSSHDRTFLCARACCRHANGANSVGEYER